ncbi:MAG: deoxyribodipyrimidine photo-lyase, partial [Sciscionella sp.]
MSDSTSEGAATLLWFRRDLRTADHPAMLRAAGGTGRVLGLFVLDEALLGPAGEVRPAYLFRCLHALNEQLRGRLLVVRGDPVQVLPRVALALGTATVHITSDAGPYGRRRDRVVGAALAANGVELVATGSPYAIAPGRVLKGDGRPYKVFTPFYRAWREHGWPEPAATSATTVSWIDPESVTGLPHRVAIEDRGRAGEITLPAAGEVAALRTWDRFREEKLGDYRAGRDRPDRSATSHLSPYLRWGCIHPRTVLAELVGDRSDAA